MVWQKNNWKTAKFFIHILDTDLYDNFMNFMKTRICVDWFILSKKNPLYLACNLKSACIKNRYLYNYFIRSLLYIWCWCISVCIDKSRRCHKVDEFLCIYNISVRGLKHAVHTCIPQMPFVLHCIAMLNQAQNATKHLSNYLLYLGSISVQTTVFNTTPIETSMVWKAVQRPMSTRRTTQMTTNDLFYMEFVCTNKQKMLIALRLRQRW